MPYPLNLDGDDYTVYELLFKINYIVGTRPANTPEGLRNSNLHMDTLNSVYAYLRGEYVVPPMVIGTSASPGIEELRKEVAIAVTNRGYDMPHYVLSPEELSDGEEFNPRAFWKSELETIVRCLKEAEDQREWTP